MMWKRPDSAMKTLSSALFVTCLAITTMASGEVCPELAGRSMLSSTNIPWLEDAVFDGRYAYGADAFGLAVWDLVDPDNPVHLAHWETPQRAQGVALGPGDLVLLADWWSGLFLIDVSDPTSPHAVGHFDGDGAAYSALVSGNTAYLAAGSGGLQILDISDPASPNLLGSYDTPGDARGVLVSGTTAYVADGGSGLQILDVSNPASPHSLGSLDTSGWAYGVGLSGSLALIADDSGGLQIIDVSDPGAPRLAGSYGSWSARDVVASGSIAYVAGGYQGLQVFDISNPADPQLLTAINTNGFDVHVSVSGTTVIAAEYFLGIKIIDVGTPQSPQQLSANNTNGSALQVVVSGTIAYIADGPAGLQIADVSDGSGFPLLGSFGTRDSTRDLAVNDHTVYLADQTGGLQIVDTADPTRPHLLGSVDVPGGAWGVDVVGTLAFVAQQEQEYGMLIVDTSDPANPAILSNIVTAGYAADVTVVGETAYLADGDAGLKIYNVRDPRAPQLLGGLNGEGVALHVVVDGEIAYVANDPLGLEIIDVSDPTSPTKLNTYTSGGQAQDVAVQDGVATIAHGNGGVSIVDLQVPSNPQTRSEFYSHDRANGIAVSGDLVYVADTLGLEIFTTRCQSPQADFDWDATGLTATFRDRSLYGVWFVSWDFGDGSTSAASQPLHRFEAAGSYTVTLTVTNHSGTDTVSHTVTVGQSSPGIDDPGAFISILSGAAHISGSAGTNWVSDLVLWNPTGSAVNANLFFLESGRDNSDVGGHTITLESWHSLKFDDVVDTLFGKSRAAGAILVGGDHALKTSLRTYNDVASGTYGQFIPGLSTTEAIGTDQPVRLIQLTRNDDYRTNIGFSNASDDAVSVGVALYRDDGSLIANRSYTIEPYGFYQETDIVGADVSDAYAVVESSTPGAAYFTYASVVDNRTGDPVFVMPDSPTVSAGESLFIPTSAHVDGAGGTVWRTDLEIHNPGTSQAAFTIELLRRDQANPAPSSTSFTLDAGAGVRYADVLSELFQFDGAAALRITSTEGTITASSRTYNQTPEGTYGQFIPAVTEGAAIDSTNSLPLTQLSESGLTNQGYRTNIGLLNITDKTFDVRVDLYNEDGVPLGMKVVTLRASEHKQVDKIFRSVASGGLDNCYAHISTSDPEARFLAYGSVIDNRSGDPVYIPAAN